MATIRPQKIRALFRVTCEKPCWGIVFLMSESPWKSN